LNPLFAHTFLSHWRFHVPVFLESLRTKQALIGMGGTQGPYNLGGQPGLATVPQLALPNLLQKKVVSEMVL
jgi:hypothetical protein